MQLQKSATRHYPEHKLAFETLLRLSFPDAHVYLGVHMARMYHLAPVNLNSSLVKCRLFVGDYEYLLFGGVHY